MKKDAKPFCPPAPPELRALRVVVAPDSFKGTLTAAEAAAAIAEGLAEILPPGSRIDCVPMADGGEGTVDAFLAAVRELAVHA